jgi:OOP family OmpA-OmpF porin
MKRIIAAALLASAVAVPAHADQGFYASVDAGQLSFTGGASSYYPKPGAITLGGGYHFNRNLGVEAGYSIVGDSTVTTIYSGLGSITQTIKTKVFQVVAVGTYPISEKFELFGKLGLAYDKFDYTATSTGSIVITSGNNSSASKTNLTYGIGGQFNFNQRFGIRVQYQDFGKATMSNCTGDCNIGATLISLGGVFSF